MNISAPPTVTPSVTQSSRGRHLWWPRHYVEYARENYASDPLDSTIIVGWDCCFHRVFIADAIYSRRN